MPSIRVPLASVVVAAGLVGLAGCGSSAVTSSTSLDALGRRLVSDADQVASREASLLATQPEVSRRGDRDLTCPGGKRREYRASITAPVSASGSPENLNNAQNLTFQTAFKPLGYTLRTDIGSSAADVPATLRFTNDPDSDDQQRTFTTMVKRAGDDFTVTIIGRTACIAD